MFEALLGAYRVVRDGQVGLLYRDGVFQRQVPPGRHRITRRQSLTLVTTMQQLAVVNGQEVLSADGFLPRVTALASFTVADPYRAVAGHETAYALLLQTEVQLAVRALVTARTAEALAKAPREELDAELLAAVRPPSAAFGLDVSAVRVRDIGLPADLRRLLTGVEKARREGQAALERAHAEQAALRALANAARMLRNNPELQNLRLLQALDGGRNTVVLGTPAGIVPLRPGETEPG